jgi:type IV pilus assembly protein PilB
LCPSCKQAYAPNPKLLAKIGLPQETKALYRHRVRPQELARGEVWETCPKCNDLGYFGQVAMFELLEMTEGMQEVVRQGATPDLIRRQMKEDDMLTLQKDGLRLVAEGLTSLEELQRAFKA